MGIDAPLGGLVLSGKRSAFPHAVPSKDRLKKGDALILSYTCQLGGYAVECERSFIVGKPTDYAKRLYDAMLAAHDTGVDRKSTRLNSSHQIISYAVFCLKKKKHTQKHGITRRLGEQHL